MSNLLLQLRDPHHILFIVFFYVALRMVYAGNHFTGSSTTMPAILTLVGTLYSLLAFAYLIIVAIKVSILLAVALLVITFIISSIFSTWRNRYIFRKVRREYPDDNHLTHLSLATAKSDIVIVVVAEIGMLVCVPILFYLVPYVMKLL